MDAVPLNQSWWVVPGKLLAGGYPGAPEASKAREKLSRLLDAGVRAVLCLQPPDERGGGGQPFVPYEPMLEQLARDRGHRVDLHRFPIRDGNVPTPERMAEILDTIDQAIDSGRPLYVHCWGGHGRTGTVVGCWLVRHGMDGQQALHHIAELRRGHPELRHRPSPEMSAQEGMVRAWPRGAAPASGVACDPPGLADRTRGALLGLAAGDALGTTLEFEHPGTFEPIDDMIGGGPFHLKPGEWTDDTSMALCLAASLVEKQGFDPLDQMHRYCRWWREGYLSSTGRCFDIGNTVSSALATFERTGDPWAGPTHPRSAGNGSLMRLAPVPLAFATNPAQAIQMAGD
ncbi:ADP-ribosylglycohydrolase family protein, partial [bacterium]|nr:ADP-ribosylglycohydrolase family protein [bacterium]